MSIKASDITGAAPSSVTAEADNFKEKKVQKIPLEKLTDTRSPRRRKFDDDVAFGIEQTIFCFITDFIDPFVGGRVQNMYDAWKDIDDPTMSRGQKLKKSWVDSRQENREKKDIIEKIERQKQGLPLENEERHKSAFEHALKGEVAGDLTAIFAFVAMRQWLPQPIEWTKNLFRTIGDKKLEKNAKKELQNWAFKEQVEEGSEKYRAKVEEWKERNAEYMARSTAMSFWSTVNNIGFQRWDDNHRPIKIIGLSKGMGALITWATMVGMRFIMPKTMHEMDEELSKRYIAPTVNFITGKKYKLPEDIEQFDNATEVREPKLSSTVAMMKDAKVERLQPDPALVAAQANV